MFPPASFSRCQQYFFPSMTGLIRIEQISILLGYPLSLRSR